MTALQHETVIQVAATNMELPLSVDSFSSVLCIFTVVVWGSFFYAWSGDEASLDQGMKAVAEFA